MHRKRIFPIDAENPCRLRLLPLVDSISKKADEIDPLFSIFFGLNSKTLLAR
jgi:hypothetical protein